MEENLLRSSLTTKSYEAYSGFAFCGFNDTKYNVTGNHAQCVFGIPSENTQIYTTLNARGKILDIDYPFFCTLFLEEIKDKELEYKLIFRNNDGQLDPICGHGMNALARVLVEKYKINCDSAKTLRFQLDTVTFPVNLSNPIIKLDVQKKDDLYYCTTEMKVSNLSYIPKESEILKLILKENPFIDEEKFYISDLFDFICYCRDATFARNNFFSIELLNKIKEIFPDFRQLLLISKSNLQGFDFEAYAYSYFYPFPYFDPACGSSNKTFYSFIKTANIFPERFLENEVEKFTMCYPCTYETTNYLGGVQKVDFYHKEGFLKLYGTSKLYQKIEIEEKENSEIYIKYLKEY